VAPTILNRLATLVGTPGALLSVVLYFAFKVLTAATNSFPLLTEFFSLALGMAKQQIVYSTPLLSTHAGLWRFFGQYIVQPLCHLRREFE
jgi:hypothetical protein